MGLDLGIRTGEDAAGMARSLRKYLRHPDKLFRRVRDQHGNLRLSKAAKAYHPGRGVYRSSYRNARRLAVTETNIAYHTADHLRWQQMDFVVGIEIKLSGNHTVNGLPLTDICDELAGRYPKDFKFTGWHPHCRCHAVTVLKTEKEMAEDTRRILAGEEPLKGSVNTVRDVPDAFGKWVEANKDRIEAAEERGTTPYFIKDNRETVKRIIEVGIASPAETSDSKNNAQLASHNIDNAESKQKAQLISLLKDKITKLPQHQPVFIEGNNIVSGALGVTRGSIKQSMGHNKNISVLQILVDLKMYVPEAKYVGWKPVAEGKHKETACFMYYEITKDGVPYYLNIKAHLGFKAEILYCIYGSINLEGIISCFPPDSVMAMLKKISR